MTLKRLVWPIAIGAAFIVAVLMLKPASHRAASVPGADLSSRHSASPIAPASSLIADRSEPQSRPRSWRPPALDAARNSSRAGYAWILRQFGISDADLDRLAAGNYAAFFKDLTSKANAGDPNAINALGWLAWGCATQRSEAQLNSYQQSQHQEARSLPSADADWFTTFLDADISNDKQHLIACAAIDQDDSLESQIKGLAAQGDGASLFVLSLAANNMTDLRNYARQSALQGFPEGQYEYARDLLYSSQLYPSQPGDPTAMDLLRAAAEIESQGGKITLLPITVASHTPLMAAAVTPFADQLRKQVARDPALPLLSGLNARVLTRKEQAAETLSQQLAHTIHWDACMDACAERGITAALELGPGAALSRMLATRHPHIACRSVSEFRSLQGILSWLQRL